MKATESLIKKVQDFIKRLIDNGMFQIVLLLAKLTAGTMRDLKLRGII